ncbi:MAG: hypothetical protein ACXACY_10235 [Candidatus Hodarchaeales archaeon]|jgi:hypothetical protein
MKYKRKGLILTLLLSLIFFSNVRIGLAQDDDFGDQTQGIADDIFGMIDDVIRVFLDYEDPNSVISVLFNLLPVVGNNPLPSETVVLIVFASGIMVFMYRVKM